MRNAPAGGAIARTALSHEALKGNKPNLYDFVKELDFLKGLLHPCGVHVSKGGGEERGRNRDRKGDNRGRDDRGGRDNRGDNRKGSDNRDKGKGGGKGKGAVPKAGMPKAPPVKPPPSETSTSPCKHGVNCPSLKSQGWCKFFHPNADIEASRRAITASWKEKLKNVTDRYKAAAKAPQNPPPAKKPPGKLQESAKATFACCSMASMQGIVHASRQAIA